MFIYFKYKTNIIIFKTNYLKENLVIKEFTYSVNNFLEFYGENI